MHILKNLIYVKHVNYIKKLKYIVFVSVSGEPEAVGSESVSHPTYVQYVEGDGSTYIPTNGQM